MVTRQNSIHFLPGVFELMHSVSFVFSLIRYGRTDRSRFITLSFAILCIVVPRSAYTQSTPSSNFEEFLGTLETSVEQAAPSMLEKPVAERTKENQFFYANPGPWGKLKCFYIYLEPPFEMVEQLPIPHSKIRWSFLPDHAAELPTIFERAGLPHPMRKRLLDPLNQSVNHELLNLYPSLADVEAMEPGMREVIYPILAKSASNEFYKFPIVITADSVEEWYRTSKLPPAFIAKVRKMSYRRSGGIAFSDVSALLDGLNSEPEARMIIKSLVRTRSLMIQLELSDEMDIESIVKYWSSDVLQRRKDIEPIVQSVRDTQGIDTLGFVHLLPALPRKLLYTYPGANYSFHGTLPDCHWTTFNFFNYDPHEYMLDERLVSLYASEKCVRIEPPYKFGDFVLLQYPGSEEIIHSCVYLADDMVFTKNGRNWLSPWVIMKLDDVIKYYDSGKGLGIRACRLKQRS